MNTEGGRRRAHVLELTESAAESGEESRDGLPRLEGMEVFRFGASVADCRRTRELRGGKVDGG